jgi:hypothetical protein
MLKTDQVSWAPIVPRPYSHFVKGDAGIARCKDANVSSRFTSLACGLRTENISRGTGTLSVCNSYQMWGWSFNVRSVQGSLLAMQENICSPGMRGTKRPSHALIMCDYRWQPLLFHNVGAMKMGNPHIGTIEGDSSRRPANRPGSHQRTITGFQF